MGTVFALNVIYEQLPCKRIKNKNAREALLYEGLSDMLFWMLGP